jgi:uroporphyrin-III C-methyltransferase/precorrin-2 dehydrogenase/sirohydrochlorin ferrochelatase
MTDLLPIFLNLSGRDVVLVGAGRVAAGKLRQLLAAGARVTVVAPEIGDEVAALDRDPDRLRQGDGGPPKLHAEGDGVARHVDRAPERVALRVLRRAFVPEDLDGAWLVVAAAPRDVNRQVAAAAEPRRLFVNAVDDLPNATAYLSGVVRRDGVTLAISTSGDAPALTALLREGLDALLPRDLGAWITRARAERAVWRRDGVPMDERKPLLLRALNDLYETTPAVTSDANVPWLNSPEDSWL